MSSQLGVAQLGTAALANINTDHIYNLSDTLTLTDSLSFTKNVLKTVTSTLTLTQSTSYTQTSITHIDKSVFDSLNITQSLTVGKYQVFTINDTLNITDNLSKTGIFHKTLIDNLVLANNTFDRFISIPSPTLPGIPPPQNLPGSSITGVLITTSTVVVTRQQDYVTLTGIAGMIVLPAPAFNDIQKNVAEVKIIRAISGKPYSYIKTSGRNSFKYSFGLKQLKASELRAFIDNNITHYCNLANWKGETWLVQITNNPVIFVAASRGFVCPDNAEFYTVDLEFEGYKIV